MHRKKCNVNTINVKIKCAFAKTSLYGILRFFQSNNKIHQIKANIAPIERIIVKMSNKRNMYHANIISTATIS